ncbi:alpha/beta fold hydrolase [Sinorhizobium sp. RAC02]|uniref:alpha/beta fold hydrolase n=1 Tax=Sinorhizobium sp. RAC02 TaxID=1842534 RepID=UPI00085766F7|nr:alpha/beta fold hydrolase [Sinorhizobium sp. RAC02]AOF90988.1 hypothetical protein BSY16_1267 [Sinorhizobium sp. RAC02]
MKSRWIRNSASDTAIIFVHGINSDENAFRSETAFWPELILNESLLQQVGVYIFEYQSQINRPGYTLGDAVDYMREMFKIDEVDTRKQIIFICHSMGGNLVRRYLVKQSLELAGRQTKCGLFMLACPSTGSHYANLFRLIRRNYHMQLESLVASQRNVWLNDLDKDFKSLLHAAPFSIVGRELYEDLPIVARVFFPNTQVVPPLSATRYFGEPLRVPGSDHFTIASPSGPDDLQHRVFLSWLKSNFPSFSLSSKTDFDGVAATFLAAVDRGDYAGAWQQLDETAQRTLVSDFDEFNELFKTREQLGTVLSRKLTGSSQVSDPPGFAKGNYKILNFVARYSEGGLRSEMMSLRRAWSGAWLPFSYTVSIAPMMDNQAADNGPIRSANMPEL